MSALQITARDRELLGFAAEHRIFLADHVSALLGMSEPAADVRLRGLHRAGLLVRRKVFEGCPPVHRISRGGLAAIGSPLEPPRLDLRCFEHDLGLAWLWLAAHGGAFGPVAQVIGERRLRSEDARRGPGEPPLAVRLGGFGPRGVERLHYPDLLLVDPQGRRIGLELELTRKGSRRREGILTAYLSDPRIDAVVYLVTDRALGRAIAASAERLGDDSRVYVQLVRTTVKAPERDLGRVRARVSERGREAGR